MEGAGTSNAAGQRRTGHRMHWHTVLTHFPISAFLGAFLFMVLHLLTRSPCYSMAAYVSMIAGAAVMVPTGLTGWYEWRHDYRSSRGHSFVPKIAVGIAMVVLSAAIVAYQTVYPSASYDPRHFLGHALYFLGVSLLMAGAFAEGWWGGLLHHR